MTTNSYKMLILSDPNVLCFEPTAVVVIHILISSCAYSLHNNLFVSKYDLNLIGTKSLFVLNTI